MNRKLIAPLLLAVALSMLATPVAAINGTYGIVQLYSEGKGFSAVNPKEYGEFGRYICGPATFEFFFGEGYAHLDTEDVRDKYPFDGATGAWIIDCETLKVCKYLQTFKATYDEIMEMYGDEINNYRCGYIRVIVLYRGMDANKALVIVYGRSVRYFGRSNDLDWGLICGEL